MDDTRYGYLSSLILFLTLTLSLGGKALELEYISPQLHQDLEKQFRSSLGLNDTSTKILKEKNWTCDMYGVRTRLQVKRGINLYSWAKKTDAWENEGAQVVSKYQIENAALVGRNERFEDQIKINAQGQLISQLIVMSPERQVVAYSVCKAL